MACSVRVDAKNAVLSVYGEDADEVHAVILGLTGFLNTFAREHPSILQPPVPATQVHTGDQIQVHANVASVGRGSVVEADMRSIASDLAGLRAQLRQSAVSPQDDIEIATLGAAQLAAEAHDEPRLLAALRNLGHRTIEVAQQAVTAVTIEAINRAIGL